MKSPALLPAAVLSALVLFAAPAAQAGTFSEDFDNVSALSSQGWVFTNLSQSPWRNWAQGESTTSGSFPAHEGAPDAYANANFESTSASVGTISNWLLTPELTFQNGDTISFFTRTVTGSGYPDRLELRLSTSAASVNVGSSPVSVGEFTSLLVTINPAQTPGGFPETWTQYTVTLSGLSGIESGRLGFRYFVTNGGSSGTNSNYIGVDTLRVTPVPEPSAYAVAVAGLVGSVILLRRRRMRAA